MTAPKYRADIKGMVKENIADFEMGVRNEFKYGENFVFTVEDTEAFQEYKDTLTMAEMKAAFKRAVEAK